MATMERVIPTTPEENREILVRWCDQVFNRKRVEVIDELKVPQYADWSRFPGQAPTLPAYKATLTLFFAAFPDFHFDVLDTMAAGDLGLVRGAWHATHTGPFMGLPPTGRRIAGERIDFFRFAEGKMSEHWGTGLELDVLRLMGFDPGGGAPATGAGQDEVARAFIDEVVQRRNLAALNELCTGPGAAVATQGATLLALQTAIPDAQVTVEHVLEEEDRVAVHTTVAGEHQGVYLGVEPTGRPVAVTRIDIFRLEEGRVAESWHQWDNVSLLLQVGAIQVPDMPERPGPALHP